MPALRIVCFLLIAACGLSFAQKSGGTKPWWSLQPLAKQTPPAVPAQYQAWPRNDIDRFILAKLLEKKLAPSPEADRRTLLRRVCFDLTGLPPTLAEIAAFEKDDDPQAYEKVVDRLLASPRHGERWARHWMDVVHFAETHGHDQDVPRDHAWPYRDYLIDSINADKPYGRFVEEQIAGDVLYPDDPQAIVALGMLAAGPGDPAIPIHTPFRGRADTGRGCKNLEQLLQRSSGCDRLRGKEIDCRADLIGCEQGLIDCGAGVIG